MHMLLIKCSFLFEANLFALNRQGFKLARLNLQQQKHHTMGLDGLLFIHGLV
jgi:hypothetical protein